MRKKRANKRRKARDLGKRKMSWSGITKIILILSFSVGIASSAQARKELVGPVVLVPQVNDVEIPLDVKALVDVNSSKGDFNLIGEVIISSATLQLRDKIIALSEKILPQRIPTPICKLHLTQIPKLEIASVDYEARIEGIGRVSLHCTGFNIEKRDVAFKLAILARPQPPNTLRWKIVRKPELDLPAILLTAMNITKGSDYLENTIQNFLDTHGSIELPNFPGIRASLQGANFNGDTNTISFRIKGDVHADGKNFTQTIMLPLFKGLPPLKYSIPRQAD